MTLLFTVIDTPTMEVILTAIAASLWCLGLWETTEPGKLLSFLKQPILNYIDNRKKAHIGAKAKACRESQELQVGCDDVQKNIYRERLKVELAALEKDFNRFKLIMKTLNPIILCPVCMGSVHGFLLFTMYQPLSLWVIPVMVMTAGLNKIWHEKLF